MAGADRPRKRVWVQNVAVSVRVLRTRLEVAAAQGLGPDQEAAAEGVRGLLDKAEAAAFRDDPIPGRWTNWWRGTLVEAAYQNLHAARAQIVDVYDEADLAAEIPLAVARCQQTMHRDDPRRISVDAVRSLPVASQRAVLRRSIEDGYDSLDREHERVRSFRNIVLLSATLIAVLVAVTTVIVWMHPTWVPLCFPVDPTDPQSRLNCPTGTSVTGPRGPDIVVVGLLGLLGGSLAGAVSIRNLRGTSTPYDVPVALALLKVPLGAFTAIVALVAIYGGFVPGLSALDSQQQILAYSLLFGFGQQVFTRLLDRKAQSLLDELPAKDAATPLAPGGTPAEPAVPPVPPGDEGELPAPATAPAVPEPLPETAAAEPSAETPAPEPLPETAPEAGPTPPPTTPPPTPPAPAPVVPPLVAGPEETAKTEYLPNPEGDEGDQVQDAEDDVLPDAPARDHH